MMYFTCTEQLAAFESWSVTTVYVPVCFMLVLIWAVLSGWIPVPPLQGVTGPFVQADLV